MERLLRKLGYRLVPRTVEHEPSLRAGAELKVSMDWENVGVAPPYRDYRVAMRLKDTRLTGGAPFVCENGPSIQGSLPGKRQLDLSCTVPNNLAPGRYELAVGVLDPVTRMPEVRLAIAGRDAEGWYPVSELEITR